MGVALNPYKDNDDIDDTDPWGENSDTEEEPEDSVLVSGDGVPLSEEDGNHEMETQVLRDAPDASSRAVIRAISKEGYKDGKAFQEEILMQEGFDGGFTIGMVVGRACGRLYGGVRCVLKDLESKGQPQYTQQVLPLLEPVLFHTLPECISSDYDAITHESHEDENSLAAAVEDVRAVLEPILSPAHDAIECAADVASMFAEFSKAVTTPLSEACA
jgi:hypothetical protein